MFPIRPDQTNFLAGTMGELRATHFHAGIDIKTSGREGLNVYAAADGFISRIKVSTGGYGSALYLQHPNGTSSVYAHLKEFSEEVAAYVLENQYQKKTFEIELFPQPSQFKFKKGDVIALSGNSGSSSGPHLHFEIRDQNQAVLNPLNFGFKEIRDNIPPIAKQVALITKTPEARINGRSGWFPYGLKRKGYDFSITDTIRANGLIGVETYVHDKLDGAANNNGFPCMEMLVNNEPYFSQSIQRVVFSKQRNILVHSNYEKGITKRRRYNKLYLDDGNALNFYNYNKENAGLVPIKPDSVYNFKIWMTDTYGNQSSISFIVKGEGKSSEINRYNQKSITKKISIDKNLLRFIAPIKKDQVPLSELYIRGEAFVLQPSYIEKSDAVYLWNLKNGIPDSIDNCSEILFPKLFTFIPSEATYTYYNELMNIHFPKKSLFDSLFLNINYEYDSTRNLELFTIGSRLNPVKNSYKVTFKPKKIYENSDEYQLYEVFGRSYAYEGGNWKGVEFESRIRRFGTFTFLRDSLAPSIKPITLNSESLRFIIKDELSGIKSYNAYLNDEWVLLHYDYKRRLLWSEKFDKTIPFNGELIVKIEDRVGNINTYKTKI